MRAVLARSVSTIGERASTATLSFSSASLPGLKVAPQVGIPHAEALRQRNGAFTAREACWVDGFVPPHLSPERALHLHGLARVHVLPHRKLRQRRHREHCRDLAVVGREALHRQRGKILPAVPPHARSDQIVWDLVGERGVLNCEALLAVLGVRDEPAEALRGPVAARGTRGRPEIDVQALGLGDDGPWACATETGVLNIRGAAGSAAVERRSVSSH